MPDSRNPDPADRKWSNAGRTVSCNARLGPGAGLHRKLGTHISFVQSLSLDALKDEWVSWMRLFFRGSCLVCMHECLPAYLPTFIHTCIQVHAYEHMYISGCYVHTDKQRETDSETERQRDRETERQRERQTDRQTDRQDHTGIPTAYTHTCTPTVFCQYQHCTRAV